MKWYVSNGTEWKAFKTREEAQEFLKNNPDWYEMMA
jgi:viroplasmin and RNaseH domain-containing protein